MQSTESLVVIALNSSLKAYGGDIAVGSMTILSSLMQMLSMPLSGLTQGAQPIVGYNYGARQNGRVKQAFRLLMISALVFSTLYWLAVMLFPRAFVLLFCDKQELIAPSAWALRIYMGGAFMLGAQIACQQTFLAVGQAKVSLFLALLRKIVLLIPLVYILPHLLADRVMAVYLAEPVADVLASLTTVTIFSLRFRRILATNCPAAAPPE